MINKIFENINHYSAEVQMGKAISAKYLQSSKLLQATKFTYLYFTCL